MVRDLFENWFSGRKPILTKEEREDTIIEETIKKYLQDMEKENKNIIKFLVCQQITMILVGKLAKPNEYDRVFTKVETQIDDGILKGKYLGSNSRSSVGLRLAKSNK